MILVYDDIIMT